MIKEGNMKKPNLYRFTRLLLLGLTVVVLTMCSNIFGNVEKSKEKSKPTVLTAPGTPEAPSVTPGNQTLTVRWLPVKNAKSYELWWSDADNLDHAVKYGDDISGLSITLNDLENKTTYYFWLVAKNDAGASGLSPIASGTPLRIFALPSTPGVPSVAEADRQITLSWETAEGANEYLVYMSTTTGNPETVAAQCDDVSGLSTVITGLTNGTPCYFWLKAKNDVGESGFSSMVTGTPNLFPPPPAPAAPQVSIGNGDLTISWAAVIGASTYEVYYNTSASIPSTPQFTCIDLSKTITGLTNGTTYYFWLKASNNAGDSDPSSSVSGKPIADAGTPVLVSGNGQLTVSWTAIAGAEQYEVFYGTGMYPSATAAQTINAPATSATLPGLGNGTTYYVWIRGKNSTGTGVISGIYASGKPIGNMGTVTFVRGDGQIAVSWNTVAGADQYDVYRSTTNSLPATPVQTVSGLSCTITGLTNGTTYYIWVKPKNANGTGVENSAVITLPLIQTQEMDKPICILDNKNYDPTQTDTIGHDATEVNPKVGVLNITGCVMEGEKFTPIGSNSSLKISLTMANGSGYREWKLADPQLLLSMKSPAQYATLSSDGASTVVGTELNAGPTKTAIGQGAYQIWVDYSDVNGNIVGNDVGLAYNFMAGKAAGQVVDLLAPWASDNRTIFDIKITIVYEIYVDWYSTAFLNTGWKKTYTNWRAEKTIQFKPCKN